MESEVLDRKRQDLADGRDDMNLAEFPLCLMTRTAPKGVKQVRRFDVIVDKSKEIERELIITGDDEFGVPVAFDNDVLLGALKLTYDANSFSSPRVHFSRYQLAKVLRMPENGTTYRKLEKSLTKWALVRIQSKHGWWVNGEKRWLLRTFAVFSEVNVYGRRGRGADADLPLSNFEWGPVLFQSFEQSYLRKLNLDEYHKLRRPVAKQLYRFTGKHLHRRPRLEMDLVDLACTHCGMTNCNDVAKLRERFHPSVEELERIGAIARMNKKERYRKVPGQKGKVIVLVTRPSVPGPNEEVEECGDVATPAWAKGLQDRGVPPAEFLKNSSSEFDFERAIEYFDYLVEKKDPKVKENPAGFLASFCRNRWRVPTKFKTKVQREAEGKARAERKRKAAEAKRCEDKRRAEEAKAEEEQLDEALSKFSAAQLREVEAQALSAAKPFIVTLYRKSQAPETRELYRRQILRSYLLPAGQ